VCVCVVCCLVIFISLFLATARGE